MTVVKAPYTVNHNGFDTDVIAAVTNDTQFKALTQHGWTRIVLHTFSPNATIPEGILNGRDYNNSSMTHSAQLQLELLDGPPSLPNTDVVIERTEPVK
jgi:hypothetical protein